MRPLPSVPSRTSLATEQRKIIASQGRPVEVGELRLSGHTREAVDWARRTWERRLVEEHRSATIFTELLVQLRDAGAPLDIETVAVRCALDELRHAELCARVVAALGGEVCPPTATRAERLPEHGAASPRARMLRNVVYISCMSETYATALLSHQRDLATEPTLRAALESLISDEVLHGRFGWEVLAHYAPLSKQDIDSLHVFLALALGHFETEVMRRVSSSGFVPGASSLGAISPAAGKAIFEEVMLQAIVPGLERHGIEAGRLWHARSTRIM